MMTARDLFTLARDLRAAGIPYEPDLSFPLPVRHQTALYIALGHLCERFGGPTDHLRRRTSAALSWFKAIGKRSRWAGWFR